MVMSFSVIACIQDAGSVVNVVRTTIPIALTSVEVLLNSRVKNGRLQHHHHIMLSIRVASYSQYYRVLSSSNSSSSSGLVVVFHYYIRE